MSTEGIDQVILATGGYDHVIRFWQAHSGLSHKTVQHPECQVNRMEITPDRQLLAAAGFQHIRMYELNSINPNPIINYEGIQKNVTAVGFHEDGLWMYTGGEDCTVRIWDTRSRNIQCQRVFQVDVPVNCVVLHPNQVEFIVGDQNGNIHRWDPRNDTNEIIHKCKDSSIQDIAIDSEATCMAAVTNKGMCLVWSLNGGLGDTPVNYKFKKEFQAHKRYALRCKFSPDSTLLITASADTTAKIWKTADFSLMTVLQEPGVQRWVWDVAFSADSQYVITASSDNVARLWNAETGEVRRVYSGHQRVVTCLAFRDRPA